MVVAESVQLGLDVLKPREGKVSIEHACGQRYTLRQPPKMKYVYEKPCIEYSSSIFEKQIRAEVVVEHCGIVNATGE